MQYIKVLKKVLLMVLLLIILFTIIPIKSNAGIESTLQGADDFLKLGKNNQQQGVNNTKLKDASDRMYNMLFGVGMLISLMATGVLGIKFMLASAEDKATLKEALVPFLVGTFIIFSSYGIWKVAVKLGSNFNDVPGGTTLTGNSLPSTGGSGSGSSGP